MLNMISDYEGSLLRSDTFPSNLSINSFGESHVIDPYTYSTKLFGMVLTSFGAIFSFKLVYELV
jgi:hypothetical protein